MYLERKVDFYLEAWKKSPDRNPLIIEGARQIGKTASVCAFGESRYANFIKINFVEEPLCKNIVADGYSADAIVKNISRIHPEYRFKEGNTLIFFDEVQEFPDITTSLKFFKEDGKYDVICSGSLLGIHYKTISSNSVGYKENYRMYSLDFEEFLWAKGYGQDFISELEDKITWGQAISEVDYQMLKKLFLDYVVLGGMPNVVRAYIAGGDFEGCQRTQRQILVDYRDDIRKYASGMDQARILNVFESIPIQLAKENKKFQLSKVEKGARFKDYRGCIEWLVEAGICLKCNMLNYPELPIKGNIAEDRFKLYMLDGGLLLAMLDDESQYDVRANQNLGVYKGALYENFVAEAFAKNGLPLCYYKRENSTLEEDFFVRNTNNLIPVEVKADNGRSKSLRQLITSEKYGDITCGIKMANRNVSFENDVLTMPHACAFLLKRSLSRQDHVFLQKKN